MSQKSKRLMDRICKLEDKLERLKCEYNMLLVQEDGLVTYLENTTKDITKKEGDYDSVSQTVINIPPSGDKK
jgi:hypothetical protein